MGTNSTFGGRGVRANGFGIEACWVEWDETRSDGSVDCSGKSGDFSVIEGNEADCCTWDDVAGGGSSIMGG